MHLLFPIISILAITSGCIRLPQSPTPTQQDSTSLSQPDNPNPAIPQTTTYIVPGSHIMVRVNLVSGLPRRMNRAAIENLVETGKIALDLLANMAGGYNADLNVPRIRWAISGLAIQTADATREPGTSGGLFRFDELRAAYTGIGVAVAGIGDLECSFFVWRVTPIMRRRFNFLGYGQLRIALLATGEGGQNK